MLSTPLVVLITTFANLRLVGLTDAAGVTVSVFDFVIPFAVAEIVAVVLASTEFVTTSNDSDWTPTGTEMFAASG